MRRRSSSTRAAAAGAVVGLVLLTGCTDGAGQTEPPRTSSHGEASGAPTVTPAARAEDEAAPSRSVWITFPDVRPGDAVTSVDNAGDLPVTVDVASLGGGALRGAAGPRPGAVRLPEWSAVAPAHAILRLRGTGPADVLSPDEQDFAFGADFNLDETSSGTPADNGDNLIQRGLFEGPAQYKLQVDGQKLSCRVAGLDGEVIVRVPTRIEPGTWYRARCTRRADAVTLMLTEVLPGFRLGEWVKVSETGPIGEIVMPRPTPMSVGGKLASDGTIFPGSTDQLNGKVDRVMYRLIEGPAEQ